MAWDLNGVRRGMSDEQDCDGLKVQTYGVPGRKERAVGRLRYADSDPVSY
jgi:hypothetical protein